MTNVARRLGQAGVGLATAIVIMTLAIAPFLSPAWVAFEQDRAQATAWTGFTPSELAVATEAILADLVLGPPRFDVAVAGTPVLDERERTHMRDVRAVFAALLVAAVVSIAVLSIATIRTRGAVAERLEARQRAWRSVGRGAAWLVIATLGLGVIAVVAFDTLFEVFHRIFFPAGSYAFDPGTDRLVQLFPFQFWQESAIAVGAVIVVLALLVAGVARTRTHGPIRGSAPEGAAAWTSAR